MKLNLLSDLNAERAARRGAVVVTDIETGEQRLVRGEGLKVDPLAKDLQEYLGLGRSGLIEREGHHFFLNVQTPPIRVVIVGAVHVSQALAPLMRNLDLDLTIIDPRAAFATPERFPGVPVVIEWPENVLPDLALDAYTALAVLTHDPRIDDPALIAALRADCFYIGALGSRKTHERRVERLKAVGFGEPDIARIHAPIGLDIGAASPGEIAVSILAEMIAALRKDRRRTA